MVQFASRMDLLKGSEIRELLKLTAQPDILSFAGGMPAPELFPVEQMMEASIAVLKEHGREALQYSTTEGFPRLREQIAERMLAKNNIHTDADHIGKLTEAGMGKIDHLAVHPPRLLHSVRAEYDKQHDGDHKGHRNAEP